MDKSSHDTAYTHTKTTNNTNNNNHYNVYGAIC